MSRKAPPEGTHYWYSAPGLQLLVARNVSIRQIYKKYSCTDRGLRCLPDRTTAASTTAAANVTSPLRAHALPLQRPAPRPRLHRPYPVRILSGKATTSAGGPGKVAGRHRQDQSDTVPPPRAAGRGGLSVNPKR